MRRKANRCGKRVFAALLAATLAMQPVAVVHGSEPVSANTAAQETEAAEGGAAPESDNGEAGKNGESETVPVEVQPGDNGMSGEQPENTDTPETQPEKSEALGTALQENETSKDTNASVEAFAGLLSSGKGINLETTATELYVGSDWAGANATYIEEGQKVTIQAACYGKEGEWGSQYNEWGLQYMVKELPVKNNTTYKIEFDIISSIDKKIVVKLDDGGFIVETIDLKANESYHYSKEVAAEEFANKTLYFAMGAMGGAEANLAGTMEIADITLTEKLVSVPAVEIAVNREGTRICFQQDVSAERQFAKVFYGIFDSKAAAEEAASDPDKGAPNTLDMDKLTNDNWEAVAEGLSLKGGQAIAYYFRNTDTSSAVTDTVRKIYEFNPFVAKDYTIDKLNRADEGYKLIWNDEFDGTQLDMSKWSFQIGTKDPNGGPDNWGNQEKQYYTDSNHELSDGKLKITAKKEGKEGMSYTSTRIRTKTDEGETLFAAKYGRVEARMKLPLGEGLWPAFWMLPEDTSIYGTWAASGEIDIMEARGRLPGEVGGAIHYGSQWPNNIFSGKSYSFDTAETDISGYHLYSLEWEPGKITWLVDDVPYYTTSNFWSKGEGNAENYTYGAPFDVPFYVIFNLAVGGTFDQEADLSKASFPSSMEVDYVRVYQKEAGYQEDGLEQPDMDKDTEAFKSAAYQPRGEAGDYLGDNQMATLKTVTEVNPADTDWQFFVGKDFGGEATCAVETVNGSKMAKIDIAKGGNQNYAIQLIKHFPAARGYTYEISFDAKASAARSIIAKAAGDADNGWSAYGTNYDAALTTQTQHFSHRFTMDKDSDPTARLEFNLGLNTGTVWIGNVTIKQVEEEVKDTTDIPKTPLADGNQIYNGSFDQGADRLGYWYLQDVTARVVSLGDNKDYNRKAIITATGENPRLYQTGMELLQSDQYHFEIELSSEKDTGFQVAFVSKDESKVYMKESLGYKAAEGIKKYEVNFAIPKGVTDKEGKFLLILEKGSVVTVDNIRLTRTTKNNVIIDYTGVDMKPVTWPSAEWKGHDQSNGDPKFTNQDGLLTIQAATADINYQRMLFHPVSITKGIDYKLKFQAKSDLGDTYEMSVQEDNTWAEALHETIATTKEWKDYEFTFTSNMTNGGNPIMLKYLLSGRKVGEGNFYLRNATMEVLATDSGCKEVPADAVSAGGQLIKGKDFSIRLGEGAWKDAFLKAIADGKAVVMINETSLNARIGLDKCLSADKCTFTIPAEYLSQADNYRIEIAVEGYTNLVILIKASAAGAVVEVGAGAPKTELDSSVIDSLLTEADRKALESGEDVRITLNVGLLNNPSAADVGAISSILKGRTLGLYLNMELFKAAGSAQPEQLTELSDKIRVVVTIPEALRKADRTFWIVRVHNGQAVLLEDLDQNPDTIQFETDRFSTYAIVYMDSDNSNSGKNDNGNKGADNSGTNSEGNADNSQANESAAKATALTVGSVKTGDDSPVMLYVILLIAAVGVVLAVGYPRIKRSLANKAGAEGTESTENTEN
ncbi:carbohydrate binding protein [Kineothrix alysoides]|uniref:Carbohydrate binding protein n=1 Tax=Kineothrix alysoides TaxID=1469948 RepID=A0A4R1QUZ6_9FIRM|nr:family 16 glycosylhydrolase [Kineothrix alysoides]TCL56941.1 carbohydrate binding protein [Kineothrix alysoides]